MMLICFQAHRLGRDWELGKYGGCFLFVDFLTTGMRNHRLFWWVSLVRSRIFWWSWSRKPQDLLVDPYDRPNRELISQSRRSILRLKINPHGSSWFWNILCLMLHPKSRDAKTNRYRCLWMSSHQHSRYHRCHRKLHQWSRRP